MPPRYVAFFIVVFWLWSMSGVMTNEVIPRLLPGNPPPFSIDLTDEAQQTPVTWTLTAEGAERAGGSANTGVQYLEREDLYRLYEELRFWHVKPGKDSSPIPDVEILSSNLVTLEGDLRGIAVTIRSKFGDNFIQAEFAGTIEGARLDSTLKVGVLEEVGGKLVPTDRGSFDIPLKPTPVPRNANVLNPLQPVNRIPKLELGQHWAVPSMNIMTNVISQSFGGASEAVELPSLQARVLPEFRSLEYGQDKKPTDCFVIEYYDASDLVARTWVRETDRVVLRQEVHGNLTLFDCTALILTRN